MSPDRLGHILSLAAIVGVAGLLTFNSVGAWANAQDEDNVPALMETVHEYPISPWPLAKAAARKEPIDWETLRAKLPKFQEMSKALAVAKQKEVRESAAGYLGAVKALGGGIEQKDAAMTRKAIAALAKSCVDCHYEGGPAGEWEED